MRPPSSESLRAAPGGVCAPRRGVSAPLWECVSPACRARGPGVSGRAGAAPAAPRSRLSRTRVRGPAPASSQPGTGAGLRVRGSPRALATQPAAGSPRRFPGLPRRPLLIPACGRTGPLRPQRRGIAREWRTRTRAPGLVTRTPDPADLAAPPQSRVLPGAQFTLCDGGPSLCLHGALQGFSEARAMKCPVRVLSTRTALFSDYPRSCVPRSTPVSCGSPAEAPVWEQLARQPEAAVLGTAGVPGGTLAGTREPESQDGSRAYTLPMSNTDHA